MAEIKPNYLTGKEKILLTILATVLATICAFYINKTYFQHRMLGTWNVVDAQTYNINDEVPEKVVISPRVVTIGDLDKVEIGYGSKSKKASIRRENQLGNQISYVFQDKTYRGSVYELTFDRDNPNQMYLIKSGSIFTLEREAD